MIITVLAADQGGKWREAHGQEIESSQPRGDQADGCISRGHWRDRLRFSYGQKEMVLEWSGREMSHQYKIRSPLFLCRRGCSQVRSKEKNVWVRGGCHRHRKSKVGIPHCSLGPRSHCCQITPSQEQEPSTTMLLHQQQATSHHSLRADMHNVTKQFINESSGGRPHLNDRVRKINKRKQYFGEKKLIIFLTAVEAELKITVWTVTKGPADQQVAGKNPNSDYFCFGMLDSSLCYLASLFLRIKPEKDKFNKLNKLIAQMHHSETPLPLAVPDSSPGQGDTSITGWEHTPVPIPYLHPGGTNPTPPPWWEHGQNPAAATNEGF